MARVVTAFLRNRGEVLLVRPSGAARGDSDRWDGVSRSVEPERAEELEIARQAVRETVDDSEANPTLVRRGDPVATGGERGSVRPFLFDCATRTVTPSEATATHEWVQAPAMLDRETVAGLWAAYRAVGPTAETVATDREHGAATVSVHALEALRDEAAAAAADTADTTDGERDPPDSWSDCADVARTLRRARPGMTVLTTRVNRVMSEAGRTTAAVRERASAAVTAAVEADDRAAAAAADQLAETVGADATVLTCSRSGTVASALAALSGAVVVAESVPGGEGREVAAELAADDRTVTLVPDAAVASLLAAGRVEAALVGADGVLADGSLVNKVGTRGLALAGAREDVPVYGVCARDKVAPDETFNPEAADYEPPPGVDAHAPLFDRTPAELVTVVTEDGVLAPSAVREVAAEHRALAAWDERAAGADPEGTE